MNVHISQQGDTHVVTVSGAIDTEAAERLRAELARVIQLKPTKVQMNLSQVPTIGSSGIGKILIFFKELDKLGTEFEIRGIHENLYGIFKSIKLDKLFPISSR